MTQTYYRDFANSTVSSAHQISKYLQQQGVSIEVKRTRPLREALELKRQEYHLSTLGIFPRGDRNAIHVEDPSLKSVWVQLPKDLLEAGFSGKEVSRILSVGEGEMITGIAPLFNSSGGKDIVGVIAASHFLPRSLTGKMREISQAYVEYKQLKILKKPIKSSYMMALLMVTLLILFSATWFGFHLAKDITVPIKELAEATHRIANGDLNFRIKMKAADEIGMLVQSFNQMTGDLQVSRAELEQRKKYMEIVLKNVAAGVISIDEKGVMTTINTSAEEMLEISQRRKKILMVGHLLIYHPVVDRLKEMVGSGELGRIYYIYTQRVNLGVIRQDENALLSFAPHDLSVILYLLEEKPVVVSAHGESYIQDGIEDVVFLSLRFPDRKMANIHLSWLDPHKLRKITIVGSKKMVVFDDMETSDKLKIYDKGVRSPSYDTYGEYLSLRFGDITIPNIKMGEPLRLEAEHFIHCIESRAKPKTGGQQGLEVVDILIAAQKSLKEKGVPVNLGGR